MNETNDPAEAADLSRRNAMRPVRRLHNAGWSGLVLSWFLVAAIGTGSAWLLWYRPHSAIEASTSDAATYPVTASEFDDQRNLVLTFVQREPRALTLRVRGTVTFWDCQPGSSWSSGDTPIAVDGRRRVTLATSVPLFRDLLGDESGPDVVAVQTVLTELGYTNSGSGTFDASTREAVSRFRVDRGIPSTPTSPDHALALADTVWIPQSPAALVGCSIALGDQVAEGAVIATAGSGLDAATVDIPVGLQPGERVLSVEGFSAVIPSDGRIEDSDQLAALAAQPSVAAHLARATPGDEVESGVIAGQFALAEPIKVFGVPPSALLEVSGITGCVADSTATYPVEIVASSLGVSYVTFSASAPTEVLLSPGQDSSCT